MRGQVPGVGEVVESEPTTKCAASVARLTPFIVQPERYLWRPFRGDNAMNEICSDQNDDEVLQFEVSDVFLELSAGDWSRQYKCRHAWGVHRFGFLSRSLAIAH